VNEVHLNLTKVFDKNAEAYISGKYRYIINQGGTSSSKTFSTLQILVQIARKHKKQIDIVGLTVPHLKGGVINDMPKVMAGFGLDFYAMYNSTDKVISFPDAGTINFISIDKLGKAHGGRRDILFINEANHHVWAIIEQLMIRTRETVFIDFNPTNEFWAHEHILGNDVEKDRAILIRSTYVDNQFLEQSIIQSIESKRGDGTNNFWRVYGLGELGIAEGLVFNNWESQEFDQYRFAKYINGLDWGFSNDPFAFIRSAIENDTLYICEEIYQRGLLNKDSAEMVKRIVRNEVVWCDGAEPKSIQEYQSLGVKAHAAKKGAGSIESGIKKIQSFRNVVIHPSCTNVLAEFKNYQWKKDKNGLQLPEPISGYDHAIDAIRYSLVTEMVYKPLVHSREIDRPRRYGAGSWMA
jgi:phage terminase large subunit